MEDKHHRNEDECEHSSNGKITKQPQSLSTKFEGLNKKVIMPAGNAFSFTGVDVDSQGTMFTHISFALGAENVMQTPGGKPAELGQTAGGILWPFGFLDFTRIVLVVDEMAHLTNDTLKIQPRRSYNIKTTPAPTVSSNNPLTDPILIAPLGSFSLFDPPPFPLPAPFPLPSPSPLSRSGLSSPSFNVRLPSTTFARAQTIVVSGFVVTVLRSVRLEYPHTNAMMYTERMLLS